MILKTEHKSIKCFSFLWYLNLFSDTRYWLLNPNIIHNLIITHTILFFFSDLMCRLFVFFLVIAKVARMLAASVMNLYKKISRALLWLFLIEEL